MKYLIQANDFAVIKRTDGSIFAEFINEIEVKARIARTDNFIIDYGYRVFPRNDKEKTFEDFDLLED